MMVLKGGEDTCRQESSYLQVCPQFFFGPNFFCQFGSSFLSHSCTYIFSSVRGWAIKISKILTLFSIFVVRRWPSYISWLVRECNTICASWLAQKWALRCITGLQKRIFLQFEKNGWFGNILHFYEDSSFHEPHIWLAFVNYLVTWGYKN